jgi:hypothetical protein
MTLQIAPSQAAQTRNTPILRVPYAPECASAKTSPSALGSVFELCGPVATRAMDAAENLAGFLHAMADNPTAAVRANWRERLDRAFETVEDVVLSIDDHLKSLVVVVSAGFAFRHL